MREEPEAYTLAEILATIRKWRRLAVTSFLSVLVPAVLVTFLMPPLYQADARVVVYRQETAPDYGVKSTPPEVGSVLRNLERKEEVNTRAELLKSRTMVEAVVDQLHLTVPSLDRIHDVRRYVRWVYTSVRDGLRWIYDETKYTLRLSTRPTPEQKALLEREQLLKNVLDRVRADPIPDSTVIEAGFRSSDPVLARQVVNALCDEFIAYHARAKQARARDFFSGQSTHMAEGLRQMEGELNEYRRRTSAFSIEPQRNMKLAAYNETGKRLKEVETARQRTEARVVALEGQLEAEPERFLTHKESNRNPALDEIDKRLITLRLRRSELAQNYTPTSAVMQDVEREITEAEALRQDIQGRLPAAEIVGVNPVHQTLRADLVQARVELAALVAEARSLAVQLKAYEKELGTLGEAEVHVRQLEQDLKAQEDAYALYLRNREQARVSEGMAGATLSDVRIVDYAGLPLSPLRPRKLLYLGIALAASLLIGLAAPFFAEYNDRSFSSEKDVEQTLGRPVIAAFPRTGAGRER